MGRILSKEEWLRRKKIKNNIMAGTTIILMIVIIVFAVIFIAKLVRNMQGNSNVQGSGNTQETLAETLSSNMEIKVDYLKPNEYSRPQTPLKEVNGIVIHYTANPGTSAKNNRSYFQGLAEKKTTKASSHYIIGLEGEIIQCIPLTEIAYASNWRNEDTISIECCHPDATGKFNDATYDSLVSLVASLCVEYNLKEEDVIRHYDVTEKKCPLYYVDHEDAWIKLKADVTEEIKTIATIE